MPLPAPPEKRQIVMNRNRLAFLLGGLFILVVLFIGGIAAEQRATAEQALPFETIERNDGRGTRDSTGLRVFENPTKLYPDLAPKLSIITQASEIGSVGDLITPTGQQRL